MYIQNSELKLDKAYMHREKTGIMKQKSRWQKGGLKNGMFIGIARYTSASVVLLIQTDSRTRRSSTHLIWRNLKCCIGIFAEENGFRQNTVLYVER